MTILTQSATVCHASVKRTIPIFAQPKKDNGYLFDRSQMFCEPTGENVAIPLVVDTEFVSRVYHWTEKAQGSRLGITTQIKSIHKGDKGTIFAHPEVAGLLPRFPVARSMFHPIDYLNFMGYSTTLKVVSEVPKGLPVAHFYLCAHFALAEAMMMVRDECEETFIKLMGENNKEDTKAPKFEMTRRLMATQTESNGRGTTNRPYVDLPWVMTLEGVEYAVRLSWVDSGAIHGISSYKDFCEAAGVKLEDKDNFTSQEKGRMLDMAIERPEDFDAYALGDLLVYDALEGNAEGFRKVYESLGLLEYYKAPNLTIGSTVKDLFQAALKKHCGIPSEASGKGKDEWKTLEKVFLSPASAQVLRGHTGTTNALLAKVEGGRCRNNRPTSVKIVSPLVDIDISGCYGEGQRNQLYLIGVPEMGEWKANSKRNDYWTLAQFRKEFQGELVSGAWFARVSTSERLKLPQDFVASWFTDNGAGEDLMAKYVKSMPSDTEKAETDTPSKFNEEDGMLKIFNHEIHNGVIQHDFLDWLDNICSAQQRKELESKLLVKSYMVYSAKTRVDSYQALVEAYKNHNDKNTATRVGKKGEAKKLRTVDGECHAWYGVNLGELLVNELLANRKCYAKKTPMNKLFKLCVNTLYGDMTSKYFTSANTCVGNNITARARALAWYMEKGFYGFQTVTDGCAFELNKVVSPKSGRSVTPVEVTNFFRKFGKGYLSTAPIGGNLTTVAIGEVERIDLSWNKGKKGYEPVITLIGEDSKTIVYQGYEAFNWINVAAMSHLQNLFPKVDVLHAPSTTLKPVIEDGKLVRIDYIPRIGQFEFEAKDFYDSGVFHSSSNYCLTNPNGDNLKMRSYETKKPHSAVKFTGEMPGESDRYGTENNPAKDFMAQLASNPESVKRQVPFVKEAILKPSDNKNRLEHWQSIGLVPGDSFNKPGMLGEFSLSQFTFQDLAKYQVWSRAITRHKDKYKQTLERFFLNADGTLNYGKMVRSVDKLIEDGVTNPFEALDPNRHASRDGDGRTSPHPELQNYLELKNYLGTPDQTDDFDFDPVD